MKRWLHRLYARGSVNQRWLTRRFTPAGRVALAVLVASGAVGADTNLSVAYRVFSLAAGLLFLSVVFGLVLRPRVRLERVLPRFGSVGETLRYEVLVTNPSSRPQRGLVLFEDLPDPRPTPAEFEHSTEPGEARRNWVDRKLLYFRWLWLVREKLMARPGETPLADCPPRATTSSRAKLVPLRRGILRFEGATVGLPDPLGLFRGLTTLSLPQSLLVLPRRYPVPSLALPGTRQYQRGGVALAGGIGESEEFMALREHRPGDGLRHVHWRTWARIGRPVVKEFQDEFFTRHALVLDTFGPLELRPAFEEAVSVAASLACDLQTQDSLLDLLFVGARAFRFTIGRGLGHTQQMLEVLAGVDLCPGEPFAGLRRLVLEHTGDLSGCIVILIQIDEERLELLRQLRALGIPVLALVLTEPVGALEIQARLKDAPEVSVQVLETGRVREGLAALRGEGIGVQR